MSQSNNSFIRLTHFLFWEVGKVNITTLMFHIRGALYHVSDSGGCLLTGIPSTVTYCRLLCVPVFVHQDVNIFAGGCTVRGCLCSTYVVIIEVLSVRVCMRVSKYQLERAGNIRLQTNSLSPAVCLGKRCSGEVLPRQPAPWLPGSTSCSSPK